MTASVTIIRSCLPGSFVLADSFVQPESRSSVGVPLASRHRQRGPTRCELLAELVCSKNLLQDYTRIWMIRSSPALVSQFSRQALNLETIKRSLRKDIYKFRSVMDSFRSVSPSFQGTRALLDLLTRSALDRSRISLFTPLSKPSTLVEIKSWWGCDANWTQWAPVIGRINQDEGKRSVGGQTTVD